MKLARDCSGMTPLRPNRHSITLVHIFIYLRGELIVVDLLLVLNIHVSVVFFFNVTHCARVGELGRIHIQVPAIIRTLLIIPLLRLRLIKLIYRW